MKTFKQFIEQAYQAPPSPPAEVRPAAKRTIPHPEMYRTQKKVNTQFKTPFKTTTDKGTEEAMIPGVGLAGAALRRKLKSKNKDKKPKPYEYGKVKPENKGKVKLN